MAINRMLLKARHDRVYRERGGEAEIERQRTNITYMSKFFNREISAPHHRVRGQLYVI